MKIKKVVAFFVISIFAICIYLALPLKEGPNFNVSKGNTPRSNTPPILPNDEASTYLAQMAIAQGRVDEENPLANYRPAGGIAGRNALDAIYVKGVPATAQSAAMVRRLLAEGKLSKDEKLALPRILASLHNPENSTGANIGIELDLKAMAIDLDKQIAAQAAIQYARLGYLHDSESVLKGAFDSGAFSADSYYQELAHLMPTAPAEVQIQLMANMAESKNRLASDVLANYLVNGEDKRQVDFLRSSSDMAILLQKTQPEFSNTASEFGLVDAVRYSQWLRASAIIESGQSGRSIDAITINTLGAQNTDPRKILGYLTQQETTPLLRAATPDSAIYGLVEKSQQYADQFPSASMNSIMQTIALRMEHPPISRQTFIFIPPAVPLAPPVAANTVNLQIR